jgi:hypothetical protein
VRRLLALTLAAGPILLGWTASTAVAATPFVVKTSVSPGWSYFADQVTARVTVVYNPSRIDASSIRVTQSFDPWEQLGPASISSTGGTTTALRTWTFEISCLTIPCLPKGTNVQTYRLPPVTVAARQPDGTAVAVTRAWPGIDVAGRFLPPTNGSVRPQLRLQTGLPAPNYRVGPTRLALALDAFGALLIASSLGLLVWLGIRALSARRSPVDRRTPLVRALTLVRQAQHREESDRRRAVGLLARTLPRDDGELPGRASEVAWSKPQPSPTSLEDLAAAVEAELRESR